MDTHACTYVINCKNVYVYVYILDRSYINHIYIRARELIRIYICVLIDIVNSIAIAIIYIHIAIRRAIRFGIDRSIYIACRL